MWTTAEKERAAGQQSCLACQVRDLHRHRGRVPRSRLSTCISLSCFVTVQPHKLKGFCGAHGAPEIKHRTTIFYHSFVPSRISLENEILLEIQIYILQLRLFALLYSIGIPRPSRIGLENAMLSHQVTLRFTLPDNTAESCTTQAHLRSSRSFQAASHGQSHACRALRPS